ncbi:hypothetical protein LZ30DRAFT_789449, partial [Colletotrichum cereale]
AGAAVDIGAHLLPVRQQLDQTALKETLRIRTSPLYDDMATLEGNNGPLMRANRERKTQSSLYQFLGMLERKHDMQLDKLELSLPNVTPPFVCINESAEDAIKEHNATEPGVVRIYTDGSGINGHVGAAAVVTKPPVDKISLKRLEYIGTSASSTVYAAELKGLVLALHCNRFSTYTNRPTTPANTPFSPTTKPPSKRYRTSSARQDNTPSSMRYEPRRGP